MRELLIQTQNLCFGFNKKTQVLNNINLQVERGAIYGFLGPNGAGKTTTIRILLGLLKVKPDGVRLFGKELAARPKDIFRRVGALIETPSLYDHLTGLDNLRIISKIRGISDSRNKEVLSIVKLSDAASTLVKNYSLGMRQRLGLAIALLSEPELLILDEPTNGLDPNGINETRELLIALNQELGTTILISSHQLSEIERMVTHLGIIHLGQLIFQGEIHELQKTMKKAPTLQINTNNNYKAASILQSKFAMSLNAESILEVAFTDREQFALICKLLVAEEVAIYQMQLTNPGLESIFLDLTRN